MKTDITEMFGVEFPIFAFSHCRDVVAAVTKAGGVGVLGAVGRPWLAFLVAPLAGAALGSLIGASGVGAGVLGGLVAALVFLGVNLRLATRRAPINTMRLSLLLAEVNVVPTRLQRTGAQAE